MAVTSFLSIKLSVPAIGPKITSNATAYGSAAATLSRRDAISLRVEYSEISNTITCLPSTVGTSE